MTKILTMSVNIHNTKHMEKIPPHIRYVPNYFDSSLWNNVVVNVYNKHVKTLKGKLEPNATVTVPLCLQHNVSQIEKAIMNKIITCKLHNKFLSDLFRHNSDKNIDFVLNRILCRKKKNVTCVHCITFKNCFLISLKYDHDEIINVYAYIDDNITFTIMYDNIVCNIKGNICNITYLDNINSVTTIDFNTCEYMCDSVPNDFIKIKFNDCTNMTEIFKIDEHHISLKKSKGYVLQAYVFGSIKNIINGKFFNIWYSRDKYLIRQCTFCKYKGVHIVGIDKKYIALTFYKTKQQVDTSRHTLYDACINSSKYYTFYTSHSMKYFDPDDIYRNLLRSYAKHICVKPKTTVTGIIIRDIYYDKTKRLFNHVDHLDNITVCQTSSGCNAVSTMILFKHNVTFLHVEYRASDVDRLLDMYKQIHFRSFFPDRYEDDMSSEEFIEYMTTINISCKTKLFSSCIANGKVHIISEPYTFYSEHHIGDPHVVSYEVLPSNTMSHDDAKNHIMKSHDKIWSTSIDTKNTNGYYILECAPNNTICFAESHNSHKTYFKHDANAFIVRIIFINDRNGQTLSTSDISEYYDMYTERLEEYLKGIDDDHIYIVSSDICIVKDKSNKNIAHVHNIKNIVNKNTFMITFDQNMLNDKTKFGTLDINKTLGLKPEWFYKMNMYMIGTDLLMQNPTTFIIVCGFGDILNWLTGCFTKSTTVTHTTTENGLNSTVNVNGEDVYNKQNGLLVKNVLRIGTIEDFPRIVWKVLKLKGSTLYCIAKLELDDDTMYIRPFNDKNWNGHLYLGKCRCNRATVLEIQEYSFTSEVVIPNGIGISYLCDLDKSIEYYAGKIIIPDAFDNNPSEECTNGIHVFEQRHYIQSLTGDEEVKPIDIIKSIVHMV
jgi:hypothetical protein